MSYMGYVHLMTEFLKFRAKQKKQKLWILEIGVDKGQTALPLLSNLLQENLDWAMVGVDVRSTSTFDQQWHFSIAQKTNYEKNLQNCKNKFQNCVPTQFIDIYMSIETVQCRKGLKIECLFKHSGSSG